MNFGNFRKKLVKIGKDRKLKIVSDAFRKTPDAFRHDADRRQSAPSVIWKESVAFVNFRYLPSRHEIAEVHADIAGYFLGQIDPFYIDVPINLKASRLHRANAKLRIVLELNRFKSPVMVLSLAVSRRYSPCHLVFDVCLVLFTSSFSSVIVCVCVCSIFTVGVLVFVSSCVWLFLLEFNFLRDNRPTCMKNCSF